jgi:hypothetical protein
LICKDCHEAYIGQTERALKIRYKKHIRSIRYNKDDSAYPTHILNNMYQYGNIEEIMDRIDHGKKGRIMNIKENSYIYLYKKENKLIEEQKVLTNQYRNAIYGVAMTYRNTKLKTEIA